MTYTTNWVEYFKKLREREQRKLDRAISEAPIGELEAIARGLREAVKNPIQLTVNERVIAQTREAYQEKTQRQEALISRLKSYLSGLTQLQLAGEPRPPEGDAKYIEFTLANYDGRLYVSESGNGIHIWPQWGRDAEFRRIDSLKPYTGVIYFVPLSDLNQGLRRVEQQLVPILEHLTAFATINAGKAGFTPKSFVTGLYSVGARGS